MNLSLDFSIKLAAIVVAVLTYLGAKRREAKIRRAELVRAYTNDFYADGAVVALFMDIDYDRLGDQEIVGSDKELPLIRLLDYFNSMGHNWKRGVLRLDDIFPTTLAYAALRTWENDAVRRFLRQVKQWDEERYAPGSGFRYFEQLAIEIAFLCERIPVGAKMVDLVLSTPIRRSARLAVYTRSPLIRLIGKLRWRILSSAPLTQSRKLTPPVLPSDAGE